MYLVFVGREFANVKLVLPQPCEYSVEIFLSTKLLALSDVLMCPQETRNKQSQYAQSARE